MEFFKFAFVLILFQITASVKISVFYESLCYDSVKFIERQLFPNYVHLKDYIDLEFVPFGKATHNLVNNKWQFSCQHGPSECKGNKYQSCALNQKNGKDKDVNFINCVMTGQNPADVKHIRECSKKIGINWDDIHECAISRKGDDLLAANGDKTLNLESTISYVPTIIINDQYDHYIQTMSLYNFAQVVCNNLLNDTKPALCYNKTISNNY